MLKKTAKRAKKTNFCLISEHFYLQITANHPFAKIHFCFNVISGNLSRDLTKKYCKTREKRNFCLISEHFYLQITANHLFAKIHF